MDIDAFPEIESFQKLPKEVIVKAGRMTSNPKNASVLHGIVINNIGNAICDISVSVVLLDKNKIPVLSTSLKTDPNILPQGGMANFVFSFDKDYRHIEDYHLYTNWRFHE